MNQVVFYRCQHCGGAGQVIKHAWAREMVLTCAGQLEVIHILRALEDGAYGVYVVHCDPPACQTLSGAAAAIRRVAHARKLLAEIPLDQRCLQCRPYDAALDWNRELELFLNELRRKESAS